MVSQERDPDKEGGIFLGHTERGKPRLFFGVESVAKQKIRLLSPRSPAFLDRPEKRSPRAPRPTFLRLLSDKTQGSGGGAEVEGLPGKLSFFFLRIFRGRNEDRSR